MKTLLFLLMAAASSPVFACSCIADERTLEQRVDEADRVLRVRVVGAELTGESTQTEATRYERFRSERIVYRLRNVETLKGSDSVPPSLLGMAGDGRGDCTVRLQIGSEIILFVGRAEQQVTVSYCSKSLESVEAVPETDLRLLAIRKFVSDRTPIHDCENLAWIPFERKSECDARRSAAVDAWRSKGALAPER